MSDNAQLAGILDALGSAASGLTSIPGIGGIGTTIVQVIGAGLRLGAVIARSGRDPVGTMVAMQSAVPAFVEWQRRSHSIADEFMRHEPGDGE